MDMSYGSVCSGIEAATAAWHPLGMTPTGFAEIEPFPSAVPAHHYPQVQNHGDMTKLGALVLAGNIKAAAVLVGGTPCQPAITPPPVRPHPILIACCANATQRFHPVP